MEVTSYEQLNQCFKIRQVVIEVKGDLANKIKIISQQFQNSKLRLTAPRIIGGIVGLSAAICFAATKGIQEGDRYMALWVIGILCVLGILSYTLAKSIMALQTRVLCKPIGGYAMIRELMKEYSIEKISEDAIILRKIEHI